jgi:hypothetical protein
MAETLSMALAELLRKADAEPDLDTLREGVRVMTQALMELEVAQHLGAERYQRSPERHAERNGYRDRTWDTRVARSSCGCHVSVTAAFLRAYWNPASERNGRWWRPCARRTSRG